MLTEALATGVLGEYDHHIELRSDDDFLIIYGPNGVGKTKFLEIIHALSKLDGHALSQLPFTKARLTYSDGTRIEADTVADDAVTTSRKTPREVIFSLHHPKRRLHKWKFEGDGFETWLMQQTPWRPSELEGVWEDQTDGELVRLAELEERFPRMGHRPRSTPPEPFRDFKKRSSSYLIETQRLRIETAPPRSSSFRSRPRSEHASKISQHAAKMRSLINDAQTEHSTITQQLDRDFPNRVLGGAAVANIDAEAIREKYEKQNAFRSRIGQIASVDLADALSLPNRPLDEWELRLLTLYVNDAAKKLAPFDQLLRKIRLLEEVVNSRLLRKQLKVTARDGLSVEHADGRPIALESLSSGEQHEVILMFDLLFNVPEGALVLIDEPEISLHVVWQLAFIPDVQKIANLSNFRFIVATHSPQIINDAWHKSIPLGPAEVPFA